ncbi:MAG: SLATT domain-containing protein [Proteobacteria bacterium]|nr:SLATT domain-containing protein [Pseudomonadota bacterium]
MTENTHDPAAKNERRDVQPEASDVLDWSPEHRRESIHAVYQRAEKHALDAIEWYLLSKRQKKFWAQQLRLGTIGLTALAGLLPIVSEIFQSSLSPAWASVALGSAGVVLAVDKFCGYSSAWMRFIAAEHQIRQSLHEFQMDYELEQAGWDNAQPSVEQTQKILNRCKAFLYQVDAIIRQETDQWLAEFQDALKQIDNGAKARTAAQDTNKPA